MNNVIPSQLLLLLAVLADESRIRHDRPAPLSSSELTGETDVLEEDCHLGGKVVEVGAAEAHSLADLLLTHGPLVLGVEDCNGCRDHSASDGYAGLTEVGARVLGSVVEVLGDKWTCRQRPTGDRGWQCQTQPTDRVP